MVSIKSFFLVLGQFLLGFVGWVLLSSLFNLEVLHRVLINLNLSELIVTGVLIINQLVGFSLAYISFRFSLRWISIGILCGIALFLIGSIIHSPCIPPLILPFPITAFGWC